MSSYKQKCAMCGTEFSSSRTDSRFCGQNCRKGWSRRKDELHRLEDTAVNALLSLRRLCEEYPDLAWEGMQICNRAYEVGRDAGLAMANVRHAWSEQQSDRRYSWPGPDADLMTKVNAANRHTYASKRSRS